MTTTSDASATADDVMTAPEAARYLKVPLRSLTEYAARGDVPSTKLGRHRRFSRRDLEALVSKGGGR